MSSWNNDPFFQYPRTTVETSAGKVEMPILYYDNSQWMFLFWGDVNAARQLINEDLDVVSFNGKVLCGVAFYEYRDTSIADYNEVGIAIGCAPKGTKTSFLSYASLLQSLDKRTIGFTVVDLPVTTEAACAAGREIWNFPKFVTGIGFQENGKDFAGTVENPEGDDNIMSIKGRAGLGMPFSVLDLVIFSKQEDKMLRTLVNTRGLGKLSLGGSLCLEVENKDHPMGQRLHALGLDGRKPWAVVRTDKLQLRLNSGAVINKD